ncbi:MAG TPA: energy transducer TonB, partial [Noviherbaspirillum sp.]
MSAPARRSLAAIAISVAMHAGALLAALSGVTTHVHPSPEPKPITVALLPTPPVPAPVAVPAP